jgi:3-hydroxyacyl-CoA dehydrogenase
VDSALVRFGFPMGPFAMADLAGIDVGWRIRKQRRRDGDKDTPPLSWLDTLAERGRFGQKTGAGVYLYKPGERKPVADPAVDDLIAEFRAAEDIKPRVITADEIIERCLLVMVNEGAKIMEEGVAARALDIDVIWNNGYGFPAYRGGPMFWADQLGLASVLSRIEHCHATMGGNHWKPAALLMDLVRQGKPFGEFSLH